MNKNANTKNANIKNAFLTDVEFNFDRNSKSQQPRINLSKIEEKVKEFNKLPQIANTNAKKTDEANKICKIELKGFTDIDAYIDGLAVGIRQNVIKAKTQTRDKRNYLNEAETYNRNFASNFLGQQRKKIEQDIASVYVKKSDNELEHFIKSIERSNSFQNVLQAKEDELIKLKKTFNARNFELDSINKKVESLESNIQRIGGRDHISSKLPAPEKELLEADEKSLEKINNQTEILENMKSVCKDDIIVLLKKNLALKEATSKNTDLLNHAKQTLKRQEQQLGLTTNTFHDLLKGKHTISNNETVNTAIHREFSVFEDTVRFEQIVKNEDRIQRAIELKEREIRKVKEQSQMRQIEELKSTELKLIEEETQELNQYQSQLSLLMDKMEISLRNAVLSKFNELKVSNQSLNEMRLNYQHEINVYEIETATLRNAFESIYVQDKQFDCTTDMVTVGNDEPENEQCLESNFVKLDEVRRAKNQELYNSIADYQRLYQVFLDCASTLSRILYQLNPLVYKATNINTHNIMDLFTQVGLHLEKLLFQCEEDDDSNLGDESGKTKEQMYSDPKLSDQPPKWIRLRKCGGSGTQEIDLNVVENES